MQTKSNDLGGVAYAVEFSVRDTVKQQMAQHRAPVMLLENSIADACLKSYRPGGA